MIIPCRVDVPQDRWSYMNWLIIACISIAFAMQVAAIVKPSSAQTHAGQPAYENGEKGPMVQFILNGWEIKGLLGHMWLHGGIFHLLGNLLFLWIFGNAVCSKIGNLMYLPMYIVLGLLAAISHLLFQGGAMIGASGAINGIVGMFLIFFPQNDITCYFLFFLSYRPIIRQFTISSYWMILFWFAFDLLGAIMTGTKAGSVAYFAHIGGFAAGVFAAIVLLKTKIVVMEPRYEKSLLQIIHEHATPAQALPDYRFIQFRKELAHIKSEEEENNVNQSAAEPPKAANASGKTNTPQEKIFSEKDFLQEDLIRFNCTCGKRVKVPARYAGQKGQCPKCGKELQIPKD